LDVDEDGYGDSEAETVCRPTDGYVAAGGDCDDENEAVRPGAGEVCNGTDDDCDNQVDEGALKTSYEDADSDGYGNPEESTISCTAPDGYVANGGDCNDTDATVNPSVAEICGNEVDDDCNGEAADDTQTYYRDADEDGYGDSSKTTQACVAPDGYVTNNTDCDDNNAAIHPGVYETCNGLDDDCDGVVDEFLFTTYYLDTDGDEWGTSTSTTQACSPPAGYTFYNGDCDDTNPAVHPGATEVCGDGIDNDCSGGDSTGSSRTYYKDVDGDGYGDPTSATTACSAPTGYVTNYTDCNDNNAAIHPNAIETCNGKDDDCDGQVDEGMTFRAYYRDADGDGYGNPNVTTGSTCSGQPAGYVTNYTDCNDTNAAVHPGVYETCNETDDDCDGSVDEGLTFRSYYRDADNDGYGNPKTTTGSVCSGQPAGYVTNNTDCDDTDAAIHPGVYETCNGKDDDCDGVVDETLTFGTYYQDADSDNYGNSTVTTGLTCNKPAGYVTSSTDCNDKDASIHPGVSETCDGVDEDCDGQVDEGMTFRAYYRDADGDGYGDPTKPSAATCLQPAGYVTNYTDCDDANAAVHPYATEVKNGVDDDCDGKIDE
ncbi:MAG TPA: putative metal-binding motif-containing protein, partial [Patescibacteria group bacterium]|nr:putative metal-binding motif-containing protein [Patescibacteria group bacterium]